MNFVSDNAPVSIIAPLGSLVELGAYLKDLLAGEGYTTFWLRDEDRYSNFERGQWGFGAPSEGRILVNGVAQPIDTTYPIDLAHLSDVTFQMGNEIASWIWVAVSTATTTSWLHIEVVPQVYVDPTPQVVDASDVVGAALAFGNAFANSYCPDSCHDIASAYAVAIGAPLPLFSGSIIPSENVSNDHWKVVYRGDTTPAPHWVQLLQAGDIVRVDWTDPAPDTVHTFTVVNINNGLVETVDNGNGLIRHFMFNLEQAVIPESVTIYRLDAFTVDAPSSLGVVDTAYHGIIRNEMSVGLNWLEASQIDAGGLSLSAFTNQLMSQAADSTIPSLIVFDFIMGVTPTSAKLDTLAPFAQMQFNSYSASHVADPHIGPYEALGMGLAETNQFGTLFGGGTDNDFISSAYGKAFGRAAGNAQVSHFQDQLDYFEHLYEGVGISNGVAALRARGAVVGQMLGFAASEAGNDFRDAARALLVDAADGSASYGSSLIDVYGT